MKLLTFIIGILVTIACVHAQEIDKENTALILIDIQNFYFDGGKSELINPDIASKKAARVLDNFRKENMLIVHVRHNYEPGGEIHESVKPMEGEKIISKDEVNAFNGTPLKAYLEKNEIKQLVLVGMQTHMCLEGTTRAAYDLGYKCIVIGDACATKDLKYNERIIKAEDVHYSTLKTLGSYAKVLNTEEFLMKE